MKGIDEYYVKMKMIWDNEEELNLNDDKSIVERYKNIYQ